jgi:hypothetical protein
MRDVAMIQEMVDEMLDMDGDINIAGNIFTRSDVLKSLDPTAYRILCIDTADALIEDLQYDLDRLDPVEDFDEVQDLKERIAELSDI